MIEQRQRDQNYFAVCLAVTDQVIGEVFFMFEKPDTYIRSVRILIPLISVKQCRRIYAYVEDENCASQKLCQRLGMRQEGLFDPSQNNGHTVPLKLT